jgi:peptidyl-prolyl cis-trans isomerase C
VKRSSLQNVLSALAAFFICTTGISPYQQVLGQERIIATVDGITINSNDVALAELDIGSAITHLSPGQRRIALIEYLVESQLMANAAEKDKLDTGSKFDAQIKYARRRALRDMYFDARIPANVSDADARSLYDEERKATKLEEEIRARHILVDGETQARELHTMIANGGEFAKLAQQHSKDLGTNWAGGDLGYFVKGQMDDQFEQAAFALQKGQLSQPLKTKFGWHLLLIEDKRIRKIPEFNEIKSTIMALLIQRKSQQKITELRDKAKIEIIDPVFLDNVAQKAPLTVSRSQDDRTAAPKARSEYLPEYSITSEELNLRNAPNPDAEIVAKLAGGARNVFWLGEARDHEEERWIKVRAGSQVGWLNDRFVRPIAQAQMEIDRKAGQEFDGDSYRAPTVVSYEVCSHACILDERCKAMEFNRKEKTCYLYNSVPKLKRSTNADGGIKRATDP